MTQSTTTLYRSYIIEEYHLTEEPYYVAVGDEVELFEAAYEQRIPLIFKGPTGCGKTRFVEYMSYRLGQPLTSIKQADSRGVERARRRQHPLGYNRLPRRLDRKRSGWTLPSRGRFHSLDRRPA